MKSSSHFVVGAMGATLVLGACSEPTKPSQAEVAAETATAPAAAPAANARAMAAFGANFGEATNPFISVVADQRTQLALRATLKDLGEHLNAGDAEKAAFDIKTARGLLAKLEGASAAVETGPISLALDNAELTLKGETPGGEAAAQTADTTAP